MRRRQAGQSLVEYVMLLFVVVTLTSLLNKFMPGALNNLEKPIKEKFPRVYKYGDPKACGQGGDDPAPCAGTAERNPRVQTQPGNFRMFGRGP